MIFKQIVIFVALKIIELATLCVFVAYSFFVGMVVRWVFLGEWSTVSLKHDDWIAMPLIGIVANLITFLILGTIYAGIKQNWEYAGKIAEKKVFSEKQE